jgi:hypothetical protein
MVLAGSRDRNPMNRAFQPDLWPRKQTKRQAETIKLAAARNRWFESISLQRRANFRFLSGGAEPVDALCRTAEQLRLFVGRVAGSQEFEG